MMADELSLHLDWFGDDNNIAKAASLINTGIVLLTMAARHAPGGSRTWLGNEAECASAISDLRQALHATIRAIVAHNTALVTHGEARPDSG